MSEKPNPTQDLIEKLEKGIRETMNSENFKNYLKFQSTFHNYSANNTMLIMMQKPHATFVAGYKSWEKHERHVMKGEKGISILAPSPYKFSKDVPVNDPKTKKPMIDEKGKIITEKMQLEGMAFRKVAVFDVSQTAGKELPTLCKELEGSSLNSSKVIKAIESISEVPITYEDIPKAKGYYSRSENKIAIKAGMSDDQTVKTLIHEYAHSILHNKPESVLMDRATAEVQAESVAFVVSNKYGIDTSHYSFDYLASWSSSQELKEIKSSLDIIQKASDKTITAIDSYMSKEIEITKEAPVNHPAATVVPVKDPVFTVKDKIVELYSKEFPAIKYISDKTAKYIDELNSTRQDPYTIRGIKSNYKILGNKLEAGNNDVKASFNKHEAIVTDLKTSQMQLKQQQAADVPVQAVKSQAMNFELA